MKVCFLEKGRLIGEKWNNVSKLVFSWQWIIKENIKIKYADWSFLKLEGCDWSIYHLLNHRAIWMYCTPNLNISQTQTGSKGSGGLPVSFGMKAIDFKMSTFAI